MPRRFTQDGLTTPGTVWLAYRRNDPREPRLVEERRCRCGAILARDNKTVQCSPCQNRRYEHAT
jgi:hypothetical protein